MPEALRAGDDSSLARVIGIRGLTAHIFNLTVGGGIFVLPAVVARDLGAAAPLAFLVCAAAMTLIALCLAEAGSRVATTGGPAAYVAAAFGPFAGFLAAILLWLTASFVMSAISTALVGSIAAFVPVLGGRGARLLLAAALFAGFAVVNVRGVRYGTYLVEGATLAKLVPLFVFVAVGAFAITPAKLGWSGVPSAAELGRAAMVLIFAFAGIDVALVPSGEVHDPARTVPRAVLAALTAVTALYVAVQVVAQGVLGGELARHAAAPLAAAGHRFLGRGGELLMLVGAILSMFGSTSGLVLSAPRALFALGRDGFLPAAVASIHPRFRTPFVAIGAQCAIALALAATGSFTRLAVLANVSVLLLYLGCCAAAWELRRRDVRAGGAPFRTPGGAAVPAAAAAVVVWLLSRARPDELLWVGVALAAASALFAYTRPHRRSLAALRGR